MSPLFLQPLQIQNQKRKMWQRHSICPLRLKKGGEHVPRVPYLIVGLQATQA